MAKIETLQMLGIVKSFGTLRANDGIDLKLKAGEILGLLGENGAGKTTLMNILYGLYTADRGRILINGKPAPLSSPREAIGAGIGMVHQHFKLVGGHSVAENAALCPEGGFPFFFPVRRVEERLEEFNRRYGLRVEARRLIWQLSAGEQQRVEIVKVLLQGAELLILDEPTSVLTPAEAESLFSVLRRMSAEGRSVIFISHKLEEVLRICSRIVILRKGKVAGAADPGKVDRPELARMMVGREVLFSLQKRPASPGAIVLEVDRLSAAGDRGQEAVRDLSLRIRGGEIYGIAGVSGNGQRELVEAITGLRRVSGGSIRLEGRDIADATARVIGERGVAHIPEERLRFGVVPNLVVSENAVLKHHREPLFSRLFFLDYEAIRAHARLIVESFQVASPSIQLPVRSLSGGNIQKLILGREISGRHSLLVASHPTYGLDVGATEYIRGRLLEQRDEGKAVLLVSEDLEEILGLADRIGVMYEGKLVGSMSREEASLERIGLLMAGARSESTPASKQGEKR